MRQKLSYILLSVMVLFTLNSSFAKTNISTKLQWYISNGKDVVGTTNGEGASEVKSYSYTPYGQAVDYSAQQQLKINNEKLRIADNPFQYSGYYLDMESGMYYLNARYYSPEFMRFISRDSYDLANRYAYCDDDPISQTDPGGHLSSLAGILLNIGVGALVSAAALAIPVGGSAFGAFAVETIAGGLGGGLGELGQQGLQGDGLDCGKIGIQAGVGAVAGMVFGGLRTRGIAKAVRKVAPAIELTTFKQSLRTISSTAERFVFSSCDESVVFEAYSADIVGTNGGTYAEECEQRINAIPAYQRLGFKVEAIAPRGRVLDYLNAKAEFNINGGGTKCVLSFPPVDRVGQLSEKEITDLCTTFREEGQIERTRNPAKFGIFTNSITGEEGPVCAYSENIIPIDHPIIDENPWFLEYQNNRWPS